jgi:hypothetical protein
MINFQTAHWCRIAQMTATRSGLLCDLAQPETASVRTPDAHAPSAATFTFDLECCGGLL